jgi:hypothetical protein
LKSRRQLLQISHVRHHRPLPHSLYLQLLHLFAGKLCGCSVGSAQMLASQRHGSGRYIDSGLELHDNIQSLRFRALVVPESTQLFVCELDVAFFALHAPPRNVLMSKFPALAIFPRCALDAAQEYAAWKLRLHGDA